MPLRHVDIPDDNVNVRALLYGTMQASAPVYDLNERVVGVRLYSILSGSGEKKAFI